MESCQETKLIKPNQTMLKINQILRKNNFPELKPQMNKAYQIHCQASPQKRISIRQEQTTYCLSYQHAFEI